MIRLEDRNILITGANRGIGLAMAKAMINAGATVYAHARRIESLDLLSKASSVIPLEAELSDPTASDSIASQLSTHTSKLDVLINNAAFEHMSLIENLTQEDFQEILSVNLIAPVQLSRTLLPFLKQGHAPSVINVTSVHDRLAIGGNGAYCMSKAALEMFTRQAALEFADHGIRVNSFAPGAIETDMNRELIDAFGREKFEHWIPSNRVGNCDDLIAPLLMLASPEASYCNGMRLCVDGAYEHNHARYRTVGDA